MKNRIKQNGFTLTLVIMMLLLAAGQIFLLARWTNLMLVQTNFEYAKSCRRNLLESGYQWVCIQKPIYSNEAISLNADVFGKNTGLSVTINVQNDTAEIKSNCSKGNVELTRRDVYQIPKIKKR